MILKVKSNILFNSQIFYKKLELLNAIDTFLKLINHV